MNKDSQYKAEVMLGEERISNWNASSEEAGVHGSCSKAK